MAHVMRFTRPLICVIIGLGLIAQSFNVPNDRISFYVWPGLFFFILAGVFLRSALRERPSAPLDWAKVTGEYHKRTFHEDADLSSLPEVWQRELAALWRLEADVNNGAYIQFVTNWGRESYVYASEALKRIGARRMAQIVDQCQALLDEHFDFEKRTADEQIQLLPSQIIALDGGVQKETGSSLPRDVVDRIYELSYEFMDYPEDLAALGIAYYREDIEADIGARG
jgi:hypothetical protein